MSVTLQLTELEADYATQALQHEYDMTLLILAHSEAFEIEVITGATVKVELLGGIIERLCAEPPTGET